MTLKEAFSCPRHMDFQDYEVYLKQKKKLEKQIRFQSDRILDCEDSLSVLSPVIDENKYEQYSSLLRSHIQKRELLENRLEKLNRSIQPET